MVIPIAHAARGPVGTSWLRVTMIVVAALTALAVSSVAALVLVGKRVADTFDNTVTVTVEAFPEQEEERPPEITGTETILLLGSDTRGAIDPEDLDTEDQGRSDSIMVVRIPEDRKNIYVMSVMRDAWVDIPGYGYNKINAAMSYGGVPLTVETIETLLDTRIDHVALIDFEGFKGLTDALGGVTITNPNDFTTVSATGSVTFEAGTVHLNGEEALAFVRERKAFIDGDYQRVKNQQLYLNAVMSTFLSRGTLTSPAKIQEAVEAISAYMVVDEDLDSRYILGLLPSMVNIRTSDIIFFTLPTAGVGMSEDGQSIIELDEYRMEELRQGFHDDDLAYYVETHDLTEY